MDNEAKKRKTQGLYAYSIIRLLFSSHIFKNFLQGISHKNGLLGLLRKVALQQPIQVIRLIKLSLTKLNICRTPALVISIIMWLMC